MFNSLKERSDDRKKSSSVGIRCEDNKNDRLQLFLRAGCNKIVKCAINNGDWDDVFRSKFFIDMRLNTKTIRYTNTHEKCIANSDDAHTTCGILEEGFGMTRRKQSDIASNKPNATMTVNALQLAILSKQSSAIESLMNHLLFNQAGRENKSAKYVHEFLTAKVVLDFNGLDESLFSTYDRSLNQMNALHLACQYHPEAIKIIFDEIYKQTKSIAGISSIINDKQNILGYAPLHIAAKKSSVEAAR